MLSNRSRRSQSFVAVIEFQGCKILNGSLMLPRRRMRFGNHAERSDAGPANSLHPRVLHCFEGASGNVVASTYTYGTKACTDLCTRSQWVVH
eukprot:2765843-Pleurochrysis_carterae.AAC.1